MNSTPPEVRIEKEYSQGVCEDGAAILCNGQPLTIEEILRGLRERDEAHGKLEALESQESVASKEFGKWAWLESLHEMPNGSRLYTKPVPADKPARITEQDAREIAWSSAFYEGEKYGSVLAAAMNRWWEGPGRTLLNKLNADREQVPAVAVPDALQKLRLEVAEAINILAMCGDQTPVDQLGKKLAAALNASAPSHSQQSADAVKAFCKDIGLYDPEYDDQEYIEVSRHKLKEHVESLYDRRPSHESEQPDSEGE